MEVDINSVRGMSKYNLFDSYKATEGDKQNLDGKLEYTFSPRYVELLNEVMVTNNLDILSPEQLKAVTIYFKEADAGTLSDKSKQLDNFLGGL